MINPIHGVPTVSDSSHGIRVRRYYTKTGQHPFDVIEWERRDAIIQDVTGATLYHQKEVEVPASWSQNATNIVASKYFYGKLETGQREQSAKQLVDRVSRTITDWGLADGYFHSGEDAEHFYDELTFLLINQYVAFNSPVWFNCGVHRYDKGDGGSHYYWDKEERIVKATPDDYTYPQCSACFINSVQDSMSSILELAKTEGMLFKFGSGSGVNVSTLRSSKESLSGGGMSSGPVEFMKGLDAFAGVIKSGGKTRRAAKMVIMNIDHPDVERFITCKADEERKAWKLIDAGYNGAIDGEAYSSVFYQNANHSVRVTDDFMRAVEHNGDWQTRSVTTGKPLETHKAKDLLREIADATYVCGDPGLQYDSTINHWHPCIATDRIYASNPCSEYMFLNDTACNLASLNLLKFRRDDGTFDPVSFRHAVDIVITAQEIIVDRAGYPTAKIAQNSHKFRPLGLGYANLGALLMSLGYAYDSEEGRALAGAITAMMTGEAYRQSSLISRETGPFEGFEENREPFLRVMKQHRDAVDAIDSSRVPQDLILHARECWDDVLRFGNEWGIRNAQATVLAPTGTIAFMMDCDTTGIEPDIALVKYKKLVGGGYMKIVNRTVSSALERLGYTRDQQNDILSYVDANDTIEGAPHLAANHLSVFDCAFKPKKGTRSIHYMGHIRMMGAAQPFVSGAISKTVNLPEDCAVEDIMDAYLQGWKLGLKALAIYRDGSKRTQPLNTGKETTKAGEGAARTQEQVVVQQQPIAQFPLRKKLPDERQSLTHKFSIGGHEGYITVGLYEDGRPGEIFITMNKEGSTLSGIMDAFATSVSLNLQYGVPIAVLIDKFTHMRFEPSGMTKNKQIPMVKSVLDYMFRWLAVKFLPADELAFVHKLPSMEPDASQQESLPLVVKQENMVAASPAPAIATVPSMSSTPTATAFKPVDATFTFQNQSDAAICALCGAMMVRNGSCYKCMECGSTSGCS